MDDHPASGAATADRRVAVLLCSDIGDTSAVAALESAVRHQVTTARIVVIARLCGTPRRLRAAAERLQDDRIVVACRHGLQFRDDILTTLRRAGVRQDGVTVVDLSSRHGRGHRWDCQEEAIRIRAALARVMEIDQTVPINVRLASATGRTSRRGLFRGNLIGRAPIAYWSETRCSAGRCTACVYSCPQDALSRHGRAVHVDPRACTACGACLSYCDAMTLAGLNLSTFEAEAQTLIDLASARPGFGVVIKCADAASIPLGQKWLPLDVPSMMTVTAGWPLQFMAAGFAVRLVDCGDQVCTVRRRELESLCLSIVSAVEGDRTAGGKATQERRDAVTLTAPAGRLAWPRRVVLREPEATVTALTALRRSAGAVARPARTIRGSCPDGTWRIESSVASTGQISIDPERCSSCGCCVRECPTGAILAEQDSGGFTLTVDASQCRACGACTAICPENAISLRQVIDSSVLDAGRSVAVQKIDLPRCRTCGARIGELAGAIADRLTASHPVLAERLAHIDRCADCLMKG